MFAIREGVIKVQGIPVPTYSRNVLTGEESFVVEAGGSIPWENECRFAYLSLFSATHGIHTTLIRDKEGWPGGVEFTVFGEDALDGLITSLEFALAALRDARAGVRD